MVVGIAWNAGAVRARLLGRHRLGRDGAADLARRPSLDDALAELATGPYGHDLARDADLPAAQWAVMATPLWHLRVLAGWLPPAGGELARVLAGWWEVLNIENHLAGMAGAHTYPPYDLGRLDTAWARLRPTDSLREVREELAASPWEDPGSAEVPTVVMWLRLSWARRVADAGDGMSRLAGAWAALVAARALLVGPRPQAGQAASRVHLLGPDWTAARDVADLHRRLPRDAGWVLDDIGEDGDLWRAEARWWRVLDDEARGRLRHPEAGADAVFGAFGALLADAHRVQGALELSARAGADEEAIREAL